MNEDYLWDKTGGDPEIERLENMLATFRYAETDAPAVETNVLRFKPKPARKIFSFKYAAAACLTFAALASVISVRISSDETTAEKDSAQMIEFENGASVKSENPKPNNALNEKPDAPPIGNPGGASLPKTENPRRFTESKPLKIKREMSAANRRRDAKPTITKRGNADTPLTVEERFAYKQLMLALSVTGSKLQIVKNKVQSTDEKAVVKTAAEDGR